MVFDLICRVSCRGVSPFLEDRQRSGVNILAKIPYFFPHLLLISSSFFSANGQNIYPWQRYEIPRKSLIMYKNNVITSGLAKKWMSHKLWATRITFAKIIENRFFAENLYDEYSHHFAGHSSSVITHGRIPRWKRTYTVVWVCVGYWFYWLEV